MKRKIRNLIAGAVVCIAVLVGSQSVEAAQSVTGTCKYSDAYEALDILNEERKEQGLKELEMDKDLLKAAMLRAAELTVSFSHTRPNGSECFTASDKIYAENIAYGYRSPEAVMEGWLNSSGHRRNMLDGEYTSVGIGCFYSDGIYYWVQDFGYNEAAKVTKPSDVKCTYKISTTKGVETTVAGTNPLSSRVSGFKATAGSRKLTLRWKRKSGITGYQIQISTSKSFKSKQTYTIGKSKVKKTITKYKGKKLKANKRYYVRIRAYKKTKDAEGIVTMKYSKWKTVSRKTR